MPTRPDDPERQNNARAWEVFKRWDKPFLRLCSDRDPVTRGGHRIWQKLVPGALGQPHAITRGAGHFLQEDRGVEVARAIVAFMRATPLPGSAGAGVPGASCGRCAGAAPVAQRAFTHARFGSAIGRRVICRSWMMSTFLTALRQQHRLNSKNLFESLACGSATLRRDYCLVSVSVMSDKEQDPVCA